jgi:hypothetical protein
MLWLLKTSQLVNIFASKENKEINSTWLLMENLLPRKIKMDNLLKKYLLINKEIISDKLHWLKILSDRQVLKQKLTLQLSRLIVKLSKDCLVPLKTFSVEIWKSIKNSCKNDNHYFHLIIDYF